MIEIELEGFDEFEKLLREHSQDLDDIDPIIISNDCQHAWVLEYGSIPGQYPWPTPDDDTEVVIDIYLGGQRVVSVQGWAMLRGSEEEVRVMLVEELSKIDLGKPIREQVTEVINRVGNYWKEKAKERTPVSSGEAKEGWNIKFYD